MNDYQKFKELLEYFVAHLEWCENKNEFEKGFSVPENVYIIGT